MPTKPKQKSPDDVLNDIKVTEFGIGSPFPSPATTRLPAPQTVKVSPKVKEILADGQTILALEYQCKTDQLNDLGISARCLTMHFGSISWTPGKGWPTYDKPCPLSDFQPQMHWPDAKRHQIVVSFANLNWFDVCGGSLSLCGKTAGPVIVGVNDDKYDDNLGTFIVVVTGWS